MAAIECQGGKPLCIASIFISPPTKIKHTKSESPQGWEKDWGSISPPAILSEAYSNMGRQLVWTDLRKIPNLIDAESTPKQEHTKGSEEEGWSYVAGPS